LRGVAEAPEPRRGVRSGHGGPNAARAMDGNGVLSLSSSGKNPGGIFERVPEKTCLAPCPKLQAKIQRNLFKSEIAAEKN